MNKESLFNKSVHGIKWMTISSVTSTAINFLLTVILARLLNAEDYGIYQAIAVLVGFADMLWSLGIGPALIRKKDLTDDDVITGHSINILLGVMIFSFINMFVSFWCTLFSIKEPLMLRAYSFIFIFNTLLSVPKSLLYRQYEFKRLSVCNILSVIVHAIVGISLAKLGMGTWALIYGILAQYFFQILLIMPTYKHGLIFKIKKSSVRELVYFGGGYTMMQLFNYVALQGDNFIVNKTMGSVSLGYYGKAYNLMGYPANLVGQTLDQVMYPILSKSQEDKHKLKRIFCAETCMTGLIVAPISVVGVVCKSELVDFILGKEWSLVAAPMAVMVFGLFFRSAYKLNYTLLKAVGKVYTMSIMQLIYAIMVLCGSYIGRLDGLVGVSIGVSIAIIFNYIISLIPISMFLHIKVSDLFEYMKSVFVLTFLLYVIGAFIYQLLRYMGILNSMLTLIIMTILVFGSYFCAYILLQKWIVPNIVNEYLIKVWNLIKNKFMRHKN